MNGWLKFFLVSVLIFLSMCGYVVYSISKLNHQYIQVKYENDQVEYVIQDSMPKNWVRLSSLKKKQYGAFIVSEDWSYFDHNGIDYDQIKKAYESFKNGENLRGASTITQQTVKNLYLSSERSFLRKGLEALLALTLDKLVSKEKVLEIYLNIIEYGPGLYGIENASRKYFNKKSSQLNSRETAFLAMLLPNPKVYSISFRKRELSDYAKKTIDQILNKMRIAAYLTIDELEYFKNQQFSWEENLIIY